MITDDENSTSTTEEFMPDERMDSTEIQDIIATETQNWLALHGAKLFTLEVSKFIARESKRQNLQRSTRAATLQSQYNTSMGSAR